MLRITKCYQEVLNDDTPDLKTELYTVQELSCLNSKYNQKQMDSSIISKPCPLYGTVIKVIKHSMPIGGDIDGEENGSN